MLNQTPNPWLPINRPVTGKLTLFCLPFAGGAAESYRSWLDCFGDDVQVCPVDLPGRSRRFGEDLIDNLDDLVDALIEGLAEEMKNPFVFFGHSMGGLVAYELCRRLADRYAKLPEALIISAWQAPQIGPKYPLKHDLSRADFVECLRNLEGTPAEVLESEDLLDLMLPIIRNDFRLIEVWQHPAEALPLSVPALIIGGDRDPEINISDLEAWTQVLDGPLETLLLEGGHFYLLEPESKVETHIKTFLATYPLKKEMSKRDQKIA